MELPFDLHNEIDTNLFQFLKPNLSYYIFSCSKTFCISSAITSISLSAENDVSMDTGRDVEELW